jgi:hypothetical protein
MENTGCPIVALLNFFFNTKPRKILQVRKKKYVQNNTMKENVQIIGQMTNISIQ